MTKVTIQEVDHLAYLAKLDLTDAQKESMKGDLDDILWFISQLDEVDVSDIKDTEPNHIHHYIEPASWVETCEDSQEMMKNVTHPIIDNAILIRKAQKD